VNSFEEDSTFVFENKSLPVKDKVVSSLPESAKTEDFDNL
jgi:hypothetical protein